MADGWGSPSAIETYLAGVKLEAVNHSGTATYYILGFVRRVTHRQVQSVAGHSVGRPEQNGGIGIELVRQYGVDLSGNVRPAGIVNALGRERIGPGGARSIFGRIEDTQVNREARLRRQCIARHGRSVHQTEPIVPDICLDSIAKGQGPQIVTPVGVTDQSKSLDSPRDSPYANHVVVAIVAYRAIRIEGATRRVYDPARQ